MNVRKRIIWLTAAVVACIAVLFFVLPPKPATSDNQEKFLRAEGYLLGSDKAIESYIKAVVILNENGITYGNRKDLSNNQLFREEVITNVVPFFTNGAKQKFGMPRMYYYVGSVKVDGPQKIAERDLYLCGFYLRLLLDSECLVNREEAAFICLAFGIQLSEYRSHDVLYSNAIACKWKALQKLRDLYRENGNEEKAQEIDAMFQDVEREFEEFKRKQKEG